ncbi:ribulose bisphosphate carboxylase small chain [Striga asiatica]|uniref:Ribulose bisphosphate carboxylase small chain n=1 Tax=Striga asiatica TaxID=4170 RepID=A0A5A7R3E4_STRAF|nr:ribulose bisphosphate carboxylase small chain [Striga asiatica]
MPPLMIASHRSGIPAALAFNLSSQADPCSHAAALVLSATRLSAPGARVIVGALCKKKREIAAPVPEISDPQVVYGVERLIATFQDSQLCSYLLEMSFRNFNNVK